MRLVKYLSIAIVSTGLMVLAAATEAKAVTLEYDRSIGSPGFGSGQLFLPQGIDVQERTGNVFISDSENDRVSVFDQNGNFVKAIGGIGSGLFDETADLAFDKLTGNLYVGDVKNNQIDVLDADGNYLRSFGSFSPQIEGRRFYGPGGVAFDAVGNFYVADYTLDAIKAYDRDGNLIKTIGSSGNGAGQFQGPSGLSISEKSGNIYVTDQLNNRFQVLDPQGNPLLVVGGEAGSGRGQLNGPVAIEVDDEENIYVGDTFNNRIQVFDKNGNYLSEFGTAVPNATPEPLPPGASLPEPGQFNWTVGAHYDNGKLYVSDFFNSRVQVLNVKGKTSVPEPASVLGLGLFLIGASAIQLRKRQQKVAMSLDALDKTAV